MRILPLIFIALGLFITSCGSDVECTVEDFNAKTSAAVSTYNTAVNAWNADNTDENCEALKSAGEEYIDLLKDFQGCEELDGPDLAASIAEIETALATLTCN